MQVGTHLTLFDLNQTIRAKLVEAFPESLWVIAEISEIKVGTTGHCYIDLIQKDKRTNSLKAKASATIWASTFRMLRPYFETTTGRPLTSGMKILIRATVEYHELYGLSLKVMDIDPTYTIGEMELQRQQTIQKLVDDGVFEMNKQVEFPMVPLHIAVISSETSAGFVDFMHQLKSNEYGFVFRTTIFQATMQGKEAEPSILLALDSIFNAVDQFDTVVIIRGGGAQADLSYFDSYWLAFHIAQFPLPVITGIGHTKDISVCDMVSNTSVKTPTAAAELLIQKIAEFDYRLTEFTQILTDTVEELITEHQQKLKHVFRKVIGVTNMLSQHENSLNILAHDIKSITERHLSQKKWMLTSAFKTITSRTKAILLQERTTSERNKLELRHNLSSMVTSENKVLKAKEIIFKNLHPDKILRRGYSITRVNGKAIKSADKLHSGEIIKTTLACGTIISSILPTE
ncbi:exodeoxyribonuclease VII large subunit [Williamwhitmania taraxaci]|uniref:Exodeoxyribonuclease 7 large subunit n=1 Tax=Williamwhitmania taraxaci TaxID=1640674 RepID=A0A1G6GQF4_9BACT|nr:exodeoxyribonuclease VII large subunit [Williamwhitmania taraxaci]SDB84139.1 Exodeoxyribonuclease VII large subunit [Williamwhitmania taraxaci]